LSVRQTSAITIEGEIVSEFTLKDLRRIMEGAAGVADGVDWDAPGTLTTAFEEIGYDSLALLEFAARVQKEYQVPIPNGVVEVLATPAAALAYVNDHLAKG
jgi:minimal PKS acyl carrier protein